MCLPVWDAEAITEILEIKRIKVKKENMTP